MEEIYQNITLKLLDLKRQSNDEELFPTLSTDATVLIHSNPFAFCVATCLDRGTKADIIWTIPYWIHQNIGHFDPSKFYKMSIEELSILINQLPKKPRYLNAAPLTFKSITNVVIENFNADATKIWVNRNAIDVKRTFMSIYGVGDGIANMAVLLIEKAYGIQFTDLDHSRMDIKPDVHTMRVLYRLGVSAAIQENEAINAARFLNPRYPGEIDGPLWLLGRKWCTALRPTCNQCPFYADCPKIGL